MSRVVRVDCKALETKREEGKPKGSVWRDKTKGIGGKFKWTSNRV